MPRVARKNRREVCSMTNKELYVLFIMDNVRLGVPWRSRLRRRGILSAAARILGLHVYFLIKSLYFLDVFLKTFHDTPMFISSVLFFKFLSLESGKIVGWGNLNRVRGGGNKQDLGGCEVTRGLIKKIN